MPLSLLVPDTVHTVSGLPGLMSEKRRFEQAGQVCVEES
ncbi:Uncharacterised protein [Mycobacterium tuberculosis]|nr:Uncharacterised protein [Mycobacterium tuberculosis]